MTAFHRSEGKLKTLAEENSVLKEELQSMKGNSTPTNGSELGVRFNGDAQGNMCMTDIVWRWLLLFNIMHEMHSERSLQFAGYCVSDWHILC